MAYTTISPPDFDPATSLNLTDILWAMQGVAADRDKQVPLSLLKEFINTDITLTGTMIHGPGNYTVSTQAGFNELIERTAANTYKLKDEVITIKLKYLSGGYLCYGGTSYLSDGDTWGVLQTNNCTRFEIEDGGHLAVGDEPFQLYIEEGGYFKVPCEGIGSAAFSATDTSSHFFCANSGIVLDQCSVKNRLVEADTIYRIFHGNVQDNCLFRNCFVQNFNSDAASVFGVVVFSRCFSVNGCWADTISTGAYQLEIFAESGYLNNTRATNISGTGNGDIFVYHDNIVIAGAYVKNIINSTGSGNVSGFYQCDQISACQIQTIEAYSGSIYCFYACDQISACFVDDAETVDGTIYGYQGCNQISACKASTFVSTGTGLIFGYRLCYALSSCKATSFQSNSGNVYGFYECHDMAALITTLLSSTSGTVNGYYNCTEGAAFETDVGTNSANDYMDTADTNVTNKNSIQDIFTT